MLHASDKNIKQVSNDLPTAVQPAPSRSIRNCFDAISPRIDVFQRLLWNHVWPFQLPLGLWRNGDANGVFGVPTELFRLRVCLPVWVLSGVFVEDVPIATASAVTVSETQVSISATSILIASGSDFREKLKAASSVSSGSLLDVISSAYRFQRFLDVNNHLRP